MQKTAELRCVVWFGQPTGGEQDSLAQAGWVVRVSDAGARGGVGVRSDNTVIALADLRQCDDASLQMLERMVAEYPGVPWIALVSPETQAQQPLVKRIMQRSCDFFTAPLDMQRLIDKLTMVGGGRPPSEEADNLGIISAQSPAMRAVVATLRKYAPVELPVLITGETGTGKERAARALHHLSMRRKSPFIAINCGALAPNLVQAELFGHERGAFTGASAQRIGHIESAAGGTVFLDEVGDLPLDAQTSLLRFLQEGTIERVGNSHSMQIDARVVAATNIDLERAVAAGRFREDLYYRLNVLRLLMPPLRERVCDIDALAQHFLDAFRQLHSTRARTFSPAASQAMCQFGWPGNVRELVNRVQRAAVVAEGTLITERDLELEPVAHGAPVPAGLDDARTTAERDAIITCLRESSFNVSECARRLRISRVTVYRLCKKHQLVLDQLR